MYDTLTQPAGGRGRKVAVAAVLLIILMMGAAAFYSFYLGLPLPYLQGRLLGPDRGSSFTPLVAHKQSNGAPCYDNGTTYCENLVQGTKQTVGFLFQQKPANLASESVYGCVNMKSKLSKYLLTTTYTECRQQNLWPYFYGYVAKTDDFEAAVPLIYCEGTGEVVMAASACQGTARQLGYMMMSAPTALTAVCHDLAEAGGTNSLCSELGAPAARVKTSAPSPWRNTAKPADTNGDSAITAQDLLVLINALNANKTGQLPASPAAGQVPPYIDVNGDGAFSSLDFNSLFGTDDWRKFMAEWEKTAAGEAAPATPWQNPENKNDTTGDGAVVPQDQLVLINELNRGGARTLPTPQLGNQPPLYFDVNGDNLFNADDITAWKNE